MQKVRRFLFFHFFLSIASLSLIDPLSAGGYSGSAFFFRQFARVLTIPTRQVVQVLLEPSNFLVVIAVFFNSALCTLAFLGFYRILRVVQKKGSD